MVRSPSPAPGCSTSTHPHDLIPLLPLWRARLDDRSHARVSKIAPTGDRKGIKGKTVQAALGLKGIHIDASQASRAKKAVRESLQGSEADAFGRLEDYLRRVKAANPGTVTLFELANDEDGEDPQFNQAILSLGEWRVSLPTSARPASEIESITRSIT